MNNIVYLKDFKNTNTTNTAIKDNVVQSFFDSFVSDYNALLEKYNINIDDKNTAFDMASVQFFVKGMAHRACGEFHPSHTILDSMRSSIAGS